VEVRREQQPVVDMVAQDEQAWIWSDCNAQQVVVNIVPVLALAVIVLPEDSLHCRDLKATLRDVTGDLPHGSILFAVAVLAVVAVTFAPALAVRRLSSDVPPKPAQSSARVAPRLLRTAGQLINRLGKQDARVAV